MSISRACGTICLAVILSGCSAVHSDDDKRAGSGQPAKLKPEPSRNAAPAFSLKDADGRTVSLADYKGKVVLLNFWATWCGPCKIEIPWFIDFEQKYKDRGFAVIGISTDEEGWEVVKPYIQKNKINYRILLGDEPTAQLYGGLESLPTTFMIDASGKIASTHVGLVSKSDYEDEIIALLDSAKRADASASVVFTPRTK